MKKITTVLLIGIFIASMLLLAKQLFPEMAEQIGFMVYPPVRVSQIDSPYQKIIEVSLGSVRAIDSKQMAMPAGNIVFSPNDKQFAVGTENGELMMYTVEGKKLWRQKIGLGKVSMLAFVNQGKQLLVGETNPNGSLSCLDSESGQERWRIDSHAELGADLPQKIFPAFLHAVQNNVTGDIFALAQCYEFDADGARRYQTRIYRIDAEGTLLQRYPDNHNIDAWVGTVSIDEKRNHLFLSGASFYPVEHLKYDQNIYCVDIEQNQIVWTVKLDVVPPYKTATVRYAPALSPEQDQLTFLAGDGRAFFYNHDGQCLWERTISVPRSIGGVYLNATALDALIRKNRVLFFTSGTYNRMNWQLPTPLEHPAGNSIFIFDQQGALITRYTAKGTIGNMIANEELVGFPVGINLRTQDYSIHGVMLLNLQDGSEQTFLPTTGPCVRVAADTKFNCIVGVEAPMKTKEGEFIGAYKLHVWHKEERNGGKS